MYGDREGMNVADTFDAVMAARQGAVPGFGPGVPR